MSRRTKNRSYPCVLKTIINDAHNDDKSFTLNDKQIRSRLRAKFNDAHVKNTSWVANNAREYDALRSTFDNAYASKIARSRKRNTKSRDVANVETNDA